MTIPTKLTRFGFKLADGPGREPLAWSFLKPREVVFRLPRSPEARAERVAGTQALKVASGEGAVIVVDGKVEGILEPGDYHYDPDLAGDLDVVWVKTDLRYLRWRVEGIQSKNRSQVESNGLYNVTLTSPDIFVTAVANDPQHTKETLSDLELQEALNTLVFDHVASAISSRTSHELDTGRAAFVEEVGAELKQLLLPLGIEVSDFAVVSLVAFTERMAPAGGPAIEAQTEPEAIAEEPQPQPNAVTVSHPAAGRRMRYIIQEVEETADGDVVVFEESGETSQQEHFHERANAALEQFEARTPVAPAAVHPAPATPQAPTARREVRQFSSVAELVAALEQQVAEVGRLLGDGRISRDNHDRVVAQLRAQIQQVTS